MLSSALKQQTALEPSEGSLLMAVAVATGGRGRYAAGLSQLTQQYCSSSLSMMMETNEQEVMSSRVEIYLYNG